MLAMRRENDQIFGSTNTNAINNNAIGDTNDTVTDSCCGSNTYQEGEFIPLMLFGNFMIYCKQ